MKTTESGATDGARPVHSSVYSTWTPPHGYARRSIQDGYMREGAINARCDFVRAHDEALKYRVEHARCRASSAVQKRGAIPFRADILARLCPVDAAVAVRLLLDPAPDGV